jgi:hypothetical protein
MVVLLEDATEPRSYAAVTTGYGETLRFKYGALHDVGARRRDGNNSPHPVLMAG